MRLLLAEDERSLARAISVLLERSQYEVDVVYDGCEALEALMTGQYDGAILDIMMPGMDGVAVVRKLRERGSLLPVMLLTAKSEVEDKVLGLDSGANDYLTKPFAAAEFLARVRVLVRGRFAAVHSDLRMGNVVLDREKLELSSPTGSFRLASLEFQLMELLLCSSNHRISAERLQERICGCRMDSGPDIVNIYISYLRKKLAALQANIGIDGDLQHGYMLEEIT